MKNSPKISIITPSYNQGDYIEETIVSVLNQDYKNLEYIIVDGKSTDKTPEILNKYKNQIDILISEKDEGQVFALNKGFEIASGDIIGWINSDDLLMPDSINIISEKWNKTTNWITGNCLFINETGEKLYAKTLDFPENKFDWLNLFIRGKSYEIFQPSTFFSREVVEEIGLLNTKQNYSFDHEYFYKIFRKFGKPVFINEVLSKFRFHSESKTTQHEKRFQKENQKIALNFMKDISFRQKMYLYMIYLKNIA